MTTLEGPGTEQGPPASGVPGALGEGGGLSPRGTLAALTASEPPYMDAITTWVRARWREWDRRGIRGEFRSWCGLMTVMVRKLSEMERSMNLVMRQSSSFQQVSRGIMFCLK